MKKIIQNISKNYLFQQKKTIDLKCGKCGFVHNIDIEGLENFFG